ncbi:MAG: ParB/RepB/Spo0J family partition protein, partial [Clostridia bacterium]
MAVVGGEISRLAPQKVGAARRELKAGDMISDWLRRVRPESTVDISPAEGEMSEIPVDVISPNPYQPRQTFDEGSLRELADSIVRVGVLEPVLVRPHPQRQSRYQLLVGERRLRAAKIAGLESIPAVVRSVDEGDMALLGLIENLQREDLHPLEEAAAMRRMLEEFAVTQEELARGLGLSQSTISNKLRLLRLPEAVRRTVVQNGLSERHARCLLQLTSEDAQMRVAR